MFVTYNFLGHLLQNLINRDKATIESRISTKNFNAYNICRISTEGSRFLILYYNTLQIQVTRKKDQMYVWEELEVVQLLLVNIAILFARSVTSL